MFQMFVFPSIQVWDEGYFEYSSYQLYEWCYKLNTNFRVNLFSRSEGPLKKIFQKRFRLFVWAFNRYFFSKCEQSKIMTKLWISTFKWKWRERKKYFYRKFFRADAISIFKLFCSLIPHHGMEFTFN